MTDSGAKFAARMELDARVDHLFQVTRDIARAMVGVPDKGDE
jgi:hypothetical protein